MVSSLVVLHSKEDKLNYFEDLLRTLEMSLEAIQDEYLPYWKPSDKEKFYPYPVLVIEDMHHLYKVLPYEEGS